jgi:hypothetical protein
LDEGCNVETNSNSQYLIPQIDKEIEVNLAAMIDATYSPSDAKPPNVAKFIRSQWLSQGSLWR